MTYAKKGMPGVTAVAIGAFANSACPPPQFSVYAGRRHARVAVVDDDVKRMD